MYRVFVILGSFYFAISQKTLRAGCAKRTFYMQARTGKFTDDTVCGPRGGQVR